MAGDLSDVDHLYGNDIGATASGDINVVSNNTRTIQRTIRRLITTPTVIGNSAYPWQPEYGAGLAAKIGADFTPSEIQALVLSQLLQEATIARTPQPVVTVTPLPTGGATISISCFDSSGTPQTFSFNVS